MSLRPTSNKSPVLGMKEKKRKKNNTSIHNENSREKDDLRGYRLRREPSVFLSCFIEFLSWKTC